MSQNYAEKTERIKALAELARPSYSWAGNSSHVVGPVASSYGAGAKAEQLLCKMLDEELKWYEKRGQE
jgi:hypothetical protein